MLVLIVAGAAVAVTVALRQRRGATARWSPSACSRPSVQSRGLLVSLVDQETGQRGFVLTGDEEFLEPYRRGRRELRDQRSAKLRRGLRRGPGDDRRARPRSPRRLARGGAVGAAPEIAGPPRRATARRAADAGRDRPRQGRLRRGARAGRRPADAHRRPDARRPGSATPRTCALLRDVIAGQPAVTVILLVVLSALLLRRWVLAAGPTAAAPGCGRSRTASIEEEVLIDGPPEVAAIGRDAESMRRRIVAELDAARGRDRGADPAQPGGEPAAPASSPRTRGRRPSGLAIAGHGALGRGRARRRLVGGVPPTRRQHRAGPRRRVRARRRGRARGVRVQAADHRAARHRPRPRPRPSSSPPVGRDADDERFLSCLVRRRRPRAAAALAGSTRVTRRPWSSTGSTATSSPSSTPTGPLISSVTSGWTRGHHAVRARRHAARLHRRGARGPRRRR